MAKMVCYLVNGQKVPESPEASSMYHTRMWYPIRYLFLYSFIVHTMFDS